MSYLIPCSSPDVTKKNDPPTFCKESHKLEESKYVFNTGPGGCRLTTYISSLIVLRVPLYPLYKKRYEDNQPTFLQIQRCWLCLVGIGIIIGKKF